MASLDQASIADLSARFSGVLLRPDESGYDDARKVHNGLIDRRPALIARCLGTADIVDAVNFARTHGLELALRGGGHNVAGRAVCDGGLMVDLSLMKGIHVDPIHCTARAQGGATWREFNRETQLHGLATTGGVISTTGIAGLTLGGGLGWLMAKYGLAMDNLLSAEIVTAEGQPLHVSISEHADLFWAIRGGGGNFGIVTSFEYRLFPVGPTLLAGSISYAYDRARDAMRFYQAYASSVPDELSLDAALATTPSGERVFSISPCYIGSIEDGEQSSSRFALSAYRSKIKLHHAHMWTFSPRAMPIFHAGDGTTGKPSSCVICPTRQLTCSLGTTRAPLLDLCSCCSTLVGQSLAFRLQKRLTPTAMLCMTAFRFRSGTTQRTMQHASDGHANYGMPCVHSRPVAYTPTILATKGRSASKLLLAKITRACSP